MTSPLRGRWLKRDGIVEVGLSDINLHGMYLITNEQAQIGALLKLEVHVDDADPIKMFVRVCHLKRTVSGEGMGVEIYLLGPEEHLRWMRYYRRLADMRY